MRYILCGWWWRYHQSKSLDYFAFFLFTFHITNQQQPPRRIRIIPQAEMLSIKTQLWINWEKMYVIFHSKSLNKQWEGKRFLMEIYSTFVCVWLSVGRHVEVESSWHFVMREKIYETVFILSIQFPFWGFFGAYVNGFYGFNIPVVRTKSKQIKVVIRF